MSLGALLYPTAVVLTVIHTIGSLATWQWDPPVACRSTIREEQWKSIGYGVFYVAMIMVSWNLFNAHLGLWWIAPLFVNAAVFAVVSLLWIVAFGD